MRAKGAVPAGGCIICRNLALALVLGASPPYGAGAGVPSADRITLLRDADGGRPVGLAVDRSGALLVADDVGNVVWRVTAR